MEMTKEKKLKSGRPRGKGKKSYPLGGMGLKTEEDNALRKLLEDNDISLKQLQRALIRQWMEQGGVGVLNYKNEIISIKRISR
jgi:hypothetical protein